MNAWSAWSTQELRQEIIDRMNHFYRQIDGSMKWPNSVEGDLFKLTYEYLTRGI